MCRAREADMKEGRRGKKRSTQRIMGKAATHPHETRRKRGLGTDSKCRNICTNYFNGRDDVMPTLSASRALIKFFVFSGVTGSRGRSVFRSRFTPGTRQVTALWEKLHPPSAAFRCPTTPSPARPTRTLPSPPTPVTPP